MNSNFFTLFCSLHLLACILFLKCSNSRKYKDARTQCHRLVRPVQTNRKTCDPYLMVSTCSEMHFLEFHNGRKLHELVFIPSEDTASQKSSPMCIKLVIEKGEFLKLNWYDYVMTKICPIGLVAMQIDFKIFKNF